MSDSTPSRSSDAGLERRFNPRFVEEYCYICEECGLDRLTWGQTVAWHGKRLCLGCAPLEAC